MRQYCFWTRAPALSLSFTLLLGWMFAISSPLALIPFTLILFTHDKKWFPYLVALFLLPMPWYQHAYLTTEQEVTGLFYPTQMNLYQGRFVAAHITTGTLFSGHQHTPVRIWRKERWQEPAHLTGYLQNNRTLVVREEQPQPLPHFAHTRHLWQDKLRSHLLSKTGQPLLPALLIGSLNDEDLSYHFRTLGLSHLLAISGLHFGLIAAFISCSLFFMPAKMRSLCTLLLLTLYMIFLGNSPSVVRAWLFALVYFGGHLIEKRGSALNTLGIALLISLLINPLSCITLSFQLSFLATGGIITLFPLTQQMLELWLPTQRYIEVRGKHVLQQIYYVLTQLLKTNLALIVSVQLALTPLQLMLFHRWDLHSVMANLLFPWMATFSLFLTVSTLLIHLFCPLVAAPLYALTAIYTKGWLMLIDSPYLPKKSLYLETLPTWCVITIYSTLLLALICRKELTSRGKKLLS